eukprot:11746667-Karenia_brevis.AAC.1
MFKESEYEQALGDEVIQKTDAKDNRLQLGRLRTSWRLAQSELSTALKRKASGLDEDDYDKPLDAVEKQRADEDFSKIYSIKFSDEATPCETLFARVFRELRRRNVTVVPLNKVRSAAQFQMSQSSSHRKSIGNGVAIV